MSGNNQITNIISRILPNDLKIKEEHDLSGGLQSPLNSNGTTIKVSATKQAKNDVFGLECTPTKANGQCVGLAYNYTSADNYCVIYLKFTLGNYSVRIDRIDGGTRSNIYHTASKKKTEVERTQLIVRETMEGVLHYLGDTLLYLDSQKKLNLNAAVGYYYNNKGSSQLHNLMACTSAYGATSASIPSPSPVSNGYTSANNIPQLDRANDLIQPFLKIQPPASKKEIFFQEVYAVHLDEFYEYIFDNPHFNGLNDYFKILASEHLQSALEDDLSKQSSSGSDSHPLSAIYRGYSRKTAPVEKRTLSVKLDIRPRLWYRMYQITQHREQEIQIRLNSYKKKYQSFFKEEDNGELTLVLEGGDAGASATSTLQDKEDAFQDIAAEYSALRAQLYAIRDQKGAILNEIRINGYDLVEKTTNVELNKLGYDFEIVKEVLTPKEFEPYDASNIKASDLDGSIVASYDQKSLRLYPELLKLHYESLGISLPDTLPDTLPDPPLDPILHSPIPASVVVTNNPDKSDDKWNTLAQNIKNKLTLSHALNSTKQRNIEREIEQLRSFHSCSELTGKLETLNANIVSLDNDINDYKNTVEVKINDVSLDQECPAINIDDTKKIKLHDSVPFNFTSIYDTALDGITDNSLIHKILQRIDNHIKLWVSDRETLKEILQEQKAIVNAQKIENKLLTIFAGTNFHKIKLDSSDRSISFQNSREYLRDTYGITDFGWANLDKFEEFIHVLGPIVAPDKNSTALHTKLKQLTLKLHPKWRDNFRYVARKNYCYRSQHTEASWDYYKEYSVLDFFDDVVTFCDTAIQYLQNKQRTYLGGMHKKKLELDLALKDRKELIINGLKNQRMQFVEKWNNPDNFEAGDTIKMVVFPDTDPLADLVTNVRSGLLLGECARECEVKVDLFDFRNGAYRNEQGEEMQAYLYRLAFEDRANDKVIRVAFFPEINPDGKANPYMVNAVINPRPAPKKVALPRIRFVETYATGIRWKGYCLGELAHTETLFPGESKEITVERSTKISKEEVEKHSTKESNASKKSTTMEEKVQNELSDKLTKDTSISTTEEETQKESESQESSTDESSSSKKDSSHKVDVKAKAEANFLFGSASLEASYGYSSSRSDSRSRSQKDSSAKARERSQTSNVQNANKEGRESVTKNLTNTLNTAAAETSSENSVEVSVNRSYNMEDTSSSTETVTIENPNIGRTINYNFFNVQNIYSTVTRLIDVKVVIDTGAEVIYNSHTNEVRVFELEEIGKILKVLESNSDHGAMIAAVAMRQVLKNYLASVGGNGSLAFEEGETISSNLLTDLKMESKVDAAKIFDGSWLTSVKSTLEKVKGVPFRFQQIELHTPQQYTVNTGSFYLDSEVGQRPATEAYLEGRRAVEMDMQRAQLHHLQEQTRARIFHPEIPEGVQSLSMNGREAPSLLPQPTQEPETTDSTLTVPAPTPTPTGGDTGSGSTE